jgi:hypothetical protein
MKPDVISSLNRFSSALYEEPPAEAIKLDFKDFQITNVNITNETMLISMNYISKYSLEYLYFNITI